MRPRLLQSVAPRFAAATLISLSILATPLAAQRGGRGNDSTGGRGAGLPLTPTHPLKFTTDEGTWLSLDLSPDGRTIVFEMLGDLYTLPVTGGKATRITSGQAYDAMPHYSPDGKSIVFVSDRSQSDNIWIAEADGSHPRALTRDATNQHFQSPTFTPDGKYVIASKGNDLYMYYANGGPENGLRLTGDSAAGGRGAAAGGGRGGGAAPNVFLGPAIGKDGRYVYTAMRNSTGGGYNQTSLGWQIGVLDRETGHLFTKTNAVGSAMRPELSPDGKWLAYGTRNNADESLILRDLSTGDEHMLIPKIQRDDQESRANRDLLPTYAFTPDSRSIIIAHHGHFWSADVATSKETMIPFSADVDQMIAGPTHESFTFNDSSMTVRQIRDVKASPDGKRLAFVALDRVWTMDLPAGTPKRLAPSENVGEFQPAWSPDGQYIAYVTWNDIDGGTVTRMRADGSGRPEKLSAKPAYYEKPAFSNDGRRIVVGRGPRNMRVDLEELERPPQAAVGVELVWLPSNGGAETVISPIANFGRPHFVHGDSTRVYFAEGSALVSMRWDGTDQKTILRAGGGGGGRGGGGGGGEMMMSPDGSKILVQVNDQAGPRAYVVEEVPEMPNGATINVTSPAQSEVPVRQITTIGGEFSSWGNDSRHIFYGLGHSLFTYDLDAADRAVHDSITAVAARADSAGAGGGGRGAGGGRGGAPAKPIYEASRHDVVITVPKDRPSGVVALRGARIITMKGDEVIAKGDIVVRDNRIIAVGPQGKVNIPSGAKTIDVTGKTILPGYVDVHAHIWPAFNVHRSQPFEYLINLAYGVTTTRDPQTSTTDVLSYSDMVEAGEFIGPRILATGPGVFQATNIRTLDEARDVLRKYSEFYNTETIKQYMSGDRRTRQLIMMAAHEQHLLPTLEGGLDFKKNMTEAMDGYAGIEHTLPIAPLYKDVLTMLAQSGTTWTPTLIVQYGGPWAENYWYEHSDVVDDPKLNRFTPRDVVERKALRRPGWWAPSQWSFQLFAEQAAKVIAAGGRVGMGSHGQLQGLGAQWEIWNIASGGMPRHDVLKVATIYGAYSIGHEKDLGSLEAGKLADLQVLDKNPLDDIKNTNTIRYVMKNGRMYDANTMSEVWPRQRQVAKLWWWQNQLSGNGQDK
ncbi:MAG TPA: amidohydrolase family protein [Gemmatimonadaceae bacterium]|nr:amidohydrolase family protein [Gemmatimonadaceae bacterium]